MASSSSKNPMKKIIVKTSDGDLFEVEESVAMEFAVVKSFFEDNLDGVEKNVMTLPFVSTAILDRVVTYCKKHIEFRANSTPQDEVETFDRVFLKEDSIEMVKQMLIAANYLEVKDLLDLLLGAAADRIKNKSPEYVRNVFGIENDFTPAEEQVLRNKQAWAFEGVDEDD